MDGRTIQVSLLWHRAPGRPVSESGRLRAPRRILPEQAAALVLDPQLATPPNSEPPSSRSLGGRALTRRPARTPFV